MSFYPAFQPVAGKRRSSRPGPMATGVLRRLLMAATFVLPVAAHAAPDGPSAGTAAAPASPVDDALAPLIGRIEEAMSAFMRGDMKRYVTLIRHADDYTLMQPFGGPPARGFDTGDAHLAELSRYFKGGESTMELVQSYASRDMIVLVVIERQHGQVGALPDQDWSLRVTLVFRREGSEWLLAHRHADPLVHSITLEQASDLARG